MTQYLIQDLSLRSCFWIFGILALLFGSPSPTHAQTAISRFTIDGGGGSSEGGSTEVSGTIGQPDAGLLTGGNIQIRGGFWVGAGQALPTFTPTPTETPPIATPTPTETAVASTSTPTEAPVSTGLDVKPDPLDEFIDALDMIEWVSRVKRSDSDPEVFFDLSVHWIREYPLSVKSHASEE